MPGAQSGFLGKLSAERPMLATAVLAVGLTSLCVLGVRNSGDPSGSNLIMQFVLSAILALAAPVALAAIVPQRPLLRAGYAVLVVLLVTILLASAFGRLDLSGWAPPKLLAGSAIGLLLFLLASSPIMRSTLRLGAIGPIAAIIGAAGGIGYFALDGLLSSPFTGGALAIALTAGVCAGTGVGADYAQHFARGLTPRSASAFAGHAAIAPAVYSILATAAAMLIVTFQANFGAVDWRVLAGACAAVLLACATAMVFATAALSLLRPNEQAAVDENRRRQRFAESWRPIRRHIPPTTAAAASAIVGVFIVIALFEVGLADALSLAVFLVLIVIASGLTFVSFRSSILIAALLFASTVFAGYVYSVLGMVAPALAERYIALALCAIAFSQLTVSWRNAGEIWRNSRDIAQNAMSDGLRRFALALSAGGAATVVSAYAFSWEQGIGAAVYFAVSAGIGLVLAPVLMIALSTQLQRY